MGTTSNRDDIAQDNEIGPSNVAVSARGADEAPDTGHRARVRLGIQRGHPVRAFSRASRLLERVSPRSYNIVKSVNALFNRSNYTVVNVVSPIDGSVIPAYNLDPAKRALIDRTDLNSTDGDLRSFSYNGFEFGAAARVHNATLFGGWTIDRTLLNHCDELENWGNLSAVYYDASAQNSQAPKSDYHYCNQSALGLPFLNEFKLSGSYQLPWQVQITRRPELCGRSVPTR